MQREIGCLVIIAIIISLLLLFDFAKSYGIYAGAIAVVFGGASLLPEANRRRAIFRLLGVISLAASVIFIGLGIWGAQERRSEEAAQRAEQARRAIQEIANREKLREFCMTIDTESMMYRCMQENGMGPAFGVCIDDLSEDVARCRDAGFDVR